jgi:hypothetical protein
MGLQINPGMVPLDDSLPAECCKCTLPDLQDALGRRVRHGEWARLPAPPALRGPPSARPAHARALRAGAIAWTEGLALAELYAVLASTPGITTLVLKEQNAGVRPDPPPALHAAETVWAHAPHLALALKEQ